jgi:hypothetical protein
MMDRWNNNRQRHLTDIGKDGMLGREEKLSHSFFKSAK